MRYLLKPLSVLLRSRIAYTMARYLVLLLSPALVTPEKLGKIKAVFRVHDGDAAKVFTSLYINKIYNLLDLFSFPSINQHTLESRVVLTNIGYFHETRKLERPIIFAQLHSGSFFMLAVWLRFFWKKINVVYVNKTGIRNKLNNELFSGHINASHSTYRDIETGLMNHESYIIMIDGNKAKYKETVRINDYQLMVSSAVVSLAGSTNAVILPVYSRRLAWNRIEFQFYPGIRYNDSLTIADLFDVYTTDIIKDHSQWYGILDKIN